MERLKFRDAFVPRRDGCPCADEQKKQQPP
jgi:hypothetical protein